MTARSVVHNTFTIERVLPAAPRRVFAAFASGEAKNIWGDTGGMKPVTGDLSSREFDFRPGGRERFRFALDGTIYRYDARYYDIVPDQRIVYAYEMYANDILISVSVATIEFARNGDSTTLILTEQGTYFDSAEGPGHHPDQGVHAKPNPATGSACRRKGHGARSRCSVSISG